MTHVANQRIKKGGKTYLSGDPIPLADDELWDLPDGAVSKVLPDPDAAPAPETLSLAVDALPDGAFKKDGGIRAEALRGLVEHLGFEVTAEDVSAVKAAGKE